MASPVEHRGRTSPELASLLSALADLTTCKHADTLLRRSVELARERIGLARVAIFLRDESAALMRGTWGTDFQGATVDEHFVTFDIWEGDSEYYELAARDGAYWTVVDNAPLVVHLASETRVLGHGWVCCTPIRFAQRPLGMMFNDAGLSHVPVDDVKQERAALLCSVLGSALAEAMQQQGSLATAGAPERSPLVAAAVRLLDADPSLTSEQLGARLRLSASRMARRFKTEMGMSLVDYRNQLRLERFAKRFDESGETGENLLTSALDAGFGSYAQFHRVFSARQGTTPGKFARDKSARQK